MSRLGDLLDQGDRAARSLAYSVSAHVELCGLELPPRVVEALQVWREAAEAVDNYEPDPTPDNERQHR